MIWVFHGYDYLSPDTPNFPNSVMCRKSLKSEGFTDTQINEFHSLFINSYNNMLYHSATIEPQVRVIDLRGSLGGSPLTNVTLMTDCIHPNTSGFAAITANYATKLKVWSGDER